MKIKLLLILTSLLLFSQWGVSQVYVSSRTNARLQDSRQWREDIVKIHSILKSGESPARMEELADRYRMIGDFEKAESWYRKSIIGGSQSFDCRLNYARVLQGNGKYQEAKSQFKLFAELTGQPSLGVKYIASCDMAMRARNENGRYAIRALDEVNTVNSDVISINGKYHAVFATRSKKRVIGTDKDIGYEGDYDLFSAVKRSRGQLEKVRRIRGKARSRHSDFSAVDMPKSGLVLFTRVWKPHKRTGSLASTWAGSGKEQRVRILKARVRGMKGTRWNDLETFPHNLSDNSSNFHPAIHPSGDVVVFCSTRPGGFGGADLYMVKREGKMWSAPLNLGSELNSEGDELFPSFNREGFLFFASDGHIGYGGLDVYTADYSQGRYTNAVNMGSGLNSSRDDFGISWDPRTSSGYFSSNRNPASGDDIYYFRRRPGVTGRVFDSTTKKSLAGSTVRIQDIRGNEKVIITDEVGKFSEPCKINTGYLLTVDKPGFFTYQDTFWTKDIPQGRDVNLYVYLEAKQLYEMSGITYDLELDSLLGETKIKVISGGKVVDELYTDTDSADFKISLRENQDYSIIFEKEGYMAKVFNLSIGDTRGGGIREDLVSMTKGEYVLVRGQVREDSDMEAFIPQASIVIINNKTQQIVDSTLSLRDGSFYAVIPRGGGDYSIVTSKEGFLAASTSGLKPEVGTTELNVELVMHEVRFGLDNNIKVIYHTYNQTELDLLSKKDLNEIYFFLRDNPNAKLEVRSHTDSRGTKKYNLELSRRRSESVVAYIQTHLPLPDDRFIAWGFGEEYLLNRCADGVNCTEEEHANNRRTELKLVER